MLTLHDRSQGHPTGGGSNSPERFKRRHGSPSTQVRADLGEFETDLREEQTATKTYPIPGSNLIATVSVPTTDEMIPGYALVMRLSIADHSLEDAPFAGPRAVISETSITSFTYLTTVRKYVEVDKHLYAMKFQCQFMSHKAYLDAAKKLAALEESKADKK